MSENFFEARRALWKHKIEEWQCSGKSCLSWCQEHNIDYKKFLYWKHRLSDGNKEALTKNSFVELQPQKSKHSSIDITYNGFTITAAPGFHQETLSRVLTIVGGMKC